MSVHVTVKIFSGGRRLNRGSRREEAIIHPVNINVRILLSTLYSPLYTQDEIIGDNLIIINANIANAITQLVSNTMSKLEDFTPLSNELW